MQSSRATRPRCDIGAVVIGGDYHGLGIVRSLGRRGIPVCVVDDEPFIARYSRYATYAVRVSELRDYPRIIESVIRIGRRFGLQGWVLFPTRDEIVAALSQHRAELEKDYRVPTPGWETIRVAWDKRLTLKLAADLGIPTPQTYYAQDPEALALQVREYPVALKPAIKEHFIYVTQLKGLRADSREQLKRLFRRVCAVIPASEVMVQEFIPGNGEHQFSYCSFFKDGRPLAKMVVRRARQHPREFGRSSTFVETVSLPELEGPSERLLAAMGYYGLVEVEYKFDRRDGRFKLLDVNPRTWGSHAIGASAGVDFPYLLYCDQLARPVAEHRARAGARWVRLATDLPMVLSDLVRGRISPRLFLSTMMRFDIEAVFAKDDILPALAELTLLPHLIRTRGGLGWGNRPNLTGGAKGCSTLF
jgi:D-aspartate ligase